MKSRCGTPRSSCLAAGDEASPLQIQNDHLARGTLDRSTGCPGLRDDRAQFFTKVEIG